MMNYLICAVAGYLAGTSSMAYYIGRIKKVDFKTSGSGNLGASNAAIVMGMKAGILVFLHDFFKVVIVALLCRFLFPQLAYCHLVAGAAAVIGHMFPFYLGFRGGKGFASYIGLLAVADIRFALVMAVIIIAVAFLFDWIVAGTFATIFLSPGYFLLAGQQTAALILLVPSVIIFLRHIENIKRKFAGEESGVREIVFRKK